MPLKKISLKEETYELISKEKLPGESLSDTIERLVKRRGKLMDAVEFWGEVDEVDEIEENIEKVRKRLTRISKRDLDKMSRYLFFRRPFKKRQRRYWKG